MKAFIVYVHPGKDSFTREARDSFIRGLESAGHSWVLSDLYQMDFKSDMSEGEYLREAYYRRELPVPPDVAAEQEKINRSDAIVFIYPVFWSDVPAKLKGWFDRVWTYGFAYGEDRGMKRLEKGLALCVAGNTMAYFDETRLLEAMERVMLGDRFFDRVKSKELIVLDDMSREFPNREKNRAERLRRAFEAGAGLFSIPG
jgi:NAD(P)H dehydrogenase (quinone)